MKTVLRPLAASDRDLLSAALPPLLPGDWSPEELHRLMLSTHAARVLEVQTMEGPELAGFAEFQQVLDEGHLLNLAVLTAWQGRALGRELLAGVLAEMREAGCARCLLEVRRSNARAIALYESRGFLLDGVRKAYYPPATNAGIAEDALLYSLSFGSSF